MQFIMSVSLFRTVDADVQLNTGALGIMIAAGLNQVSMCNGFVLILAGSLGSQEILQ